MAATVLRLGRLREGGGALYVVRGAPANRFIAWTVLSGSGSITPIENYSNAEGVASAKYDASSDLEDATVQIQATYHT